MCSASSQTGAQAWRPGAREDGEAAPKDEAAGAAQVPESLASWTENPELLSHRNAGLLKILPKEETTIPVPTHEVGVQEAKSKAGSEGVSRIRCDQVLTSSDGNVEKMGQNEGLFQRSSHPRGHRRGRSKTNSQSSGLKEGPDN